MASITAYTKTRIDALIGAAHNLVDVIAYGAKGDGTTDDTTAVTNAIAAVASRNISGDTAGIVWFPPGTYRITSTLTIAKGIYLIGESPLDSKLVYGGTSATGTAFLTFGTTGQIATYCGVRHLQVNANNLLDWGMLMFGPQEGSGVHDSMVVGGNVGGVDARSSGITGGNNKFEISNCWIWTNGDTGMYGVKFDDANGPLVIRNTTFQATNRSGTYSTGGPAGSAGVYANGGTILIEGVNCEHWESAICVDAWTRLTAIMPSSYTTTYGLRVRAIGGADTSINYRVENEVFSGTTYMLKDEQNGLNLATLPGHRYEKFGPATGLTTVNAYTASTTLGFGDRGALVTMSSTSATTITIPTNATTFMEIGAVITIANLSTGAVTIAGASGVTVSSPAGLRITAQYGQASLVQTAANTWLLSGQTVV